MESATGTNQYKVRASLAVGLPYLPFPSKLPVCMGPFKLAETPAPNSVPYLLELGVAEPEFAIVQVKGGNVTADSVKALKSTVDRFDATAGIMVCFARQMQTVENQRSRDLFIDDAGSYPVIQGYSIEDLLVRRPLDLPLYGRRERRGGRISSQDELLNTNA